MLWVTRKREVLTGHRVAFHPSTYLHCIRWNGRPASEGDETEHRTEYFLKEQKHKLLKNAPLSCQEASLVAQTVRNLPAIQETWVQSLGWEDPLEKGMATHSSVLAWKMPWTEVQSRGSQRVGHA